MVSLLWTEISKAVGRIQYCMIDKQRNISLQWPSLPPSPNPWINFCSVPSPLSCCLSHCYQWCGFYCSVGPVWSYFCRELSRNCKIGIIILYAKKIWVWHDLLNCYLVKSSSCLTLAFVTIFPLTGLKKPGPPYEEVRCVRLPSDIIYSFTHLSIKETGRNNHPLIKELNYVTATMLKYHSLTQPTRWWCARATMLEYH